ncbi:MAG: hypothetical protein IPL52_17875 [Flavobacteriales bacterium]|nr:hypothetical protein [Flavobacteriales bacterium]
MLPPVPMAMSWPGKARSSSSESLHIHPRAQGHLVLQRAHGADLEAGALRALAVLQPSELGAATAHVDVKVGPVLQQVLRPEGVGDEIRFELAGDGLDVDAALHFHTRHHLVLVHGLAHGAGGAAAHVGHTVHLGEQPEGLERFDQVVLLGRSDRALVEDILAEADGHTHQGLLLDDGMIIALDHFCHQQTHGVGSDVDGSVCKVTVDARK